MKIALVHDYLTQRGGAERVFELLCNHFPTGDIFTSVYDRNTSIDFGDRRVNTTALQWVPGSVKNFRVMAPLYYPAFRQMDMQDYDLIISSSSSFAKGVKKRPDAKHICFCHNVTRFLWFTDTYLREYKEYKQWNQVIGKIFCQMKKLDYKYAKEPDIYIANSSTVVKRIEEIYHQKARMINFPIDSKRFSFSAEKEEFCLVVSRMISYKRIDVIVDAFNQLGWPLLIVGDGPERQRLESRGRGNIQFLGEISDAKRSQLMAKARYVIVAALEDYGLVPIEANASGTPVICYGAGGVLDSQIPGKTGAFFDPQTPAALVETLLASKDRQWDYDEIRHHALSNFSDAGGRRY